MSCLSFLYWQINISYIIPRVSEFKIFVELQYFTQLIFLTIDLRRGDVCEERTTTAYLRTKWRKGHRKYTNIKLHTFVTWDKR